MPHPTELLQFQQRFLAALREINLLSCEVFLINAHKHAHRQTIDLKAKEALLLSVLPCGGKEGSVGALPEIAGNEGVLNKCLLRGRITRLPALQVSRLPSPPGVVYPPHHAAPSPASGHTQLWVPIPGSSLPPGSSLGE